MSLGDMVMGTWPDPRLALYQALGQGPGTGLNQPKPQPMAPSPQGGQMLSQGVSGQAGNFPQMPPPGAPPQGQPPGAPPQGQPAPDQPKSGAYPVNPPTAPQPGQPVGSPQQPQAYTSPPDMASLYMQLYDKQRKSEMFNRGLGMLMAGFAHPADRASMVSSMSGMTQDPGAMIENVMKIQQMQYQQQQQRALQASLPGIAQRYGLDMNTANALWAGGKLDDFIATQEHQKLLNNAPTEHQKDYNTYVTETKAAGQQPMNFMDWQYHRDNAPTEQQKNYNFYSEQEKTAGRAPLPFSEWMMQGGAGGGGEDIKKYNLYVQQTKATGQTPLPFMDWNQKVNEHFAETPQWTQKVGTDGKPVLDENGMPIYHAVQIGDRNSVRPVVDQNGGELVRKYDKVDTGTGTALIDPISRQQVGFIPKEVAKKAEQEATGKLTGEEQASIKAGLPAMQQTVDQVNSLSDELESDNQYSNRTGIWGHLPAIPGSKSADVQAKIDQLAGTAGVHAVESLKGVGRILGTEFAEGQSAQSRLHEQGVSADAYRQAIEDYRYSQNRALATAYTKIGQPVPDSVQSRITAYEQARQQKQQSQQSKQAPASKNKTYNPKTGEFE